jgi:hypothetical protein
MTWRFFWLIFLMLTSCSVWNRVGPEATCDDLQGGAVNDCKEGIIAACTAGKVVYRVCDDEKACEATWNKPGRYGCTAEQAADFEPSGNGAGGSSGSSGSGGSSASGNGGEQGFEACGVRFKKKPCATCITATPCCSTLATCIGDPTCKSCLTRPASQAPCAPDLVPSYDAALDCLATTCMEACE